MGIGLALPAMANLVMRVGEFPIGPVRWVDLLPPAVSCICMVVGLMSFLKWWKKKNTILDRCRKRGETTD